MPQEGLVLQTLLDHRPQSSTLTPSLSVPLALPTVPGERPPHLRMYIEVFIGFKALFFTFRVVKKKALFDDEKPI